MKEIDQVPPLSPQVVAFIDKLEAAVYEHFVTPVVVGGYIYRCLYMIDDPRLDTLIQHMCPLNTELHDTVMPIMFHGEGKEKTGRALELMGKVIYPEVFEAHSIPVFRFLLRMRSMEIFESFAK